MNSLNFKMPIAGNAMSREGADRAPQPVHAPFMSAATQIGTAGRQRALVGIATLAVQIFFVAGLALGLAHEATTKIAPPMTVNLLPEEVKEPEPPPPPMKPLLQTPQIVMNLPQPPQIYTPPPLVQVNAPPSPIASTTTPPARVDPNIAIQAFQMRLLRQVNRNLRYPQGARVKRYEGVVLVRFTMDRRGNVSNVVVERGSDFSELNEEGIAVLMRASPFPPPPPELEGEKIEMVLPVKFSLRGAGGRHAQNGRSGES
jgi:protein TonB